MEKINLSTREASMYLHDKGIEFSPKTLGIWRHNGKGPRYKKIAWKVYYEKQDLDEFILGRKVETNDTVERQTIPMSILKKHSQLKLKQ